MTEQREPPDPVEPLPDQADTARDDEVIRIEDLAPRGTVRGGRKILLGEIPTPSGNPIVPPKS